jgi:CIC family chloride channel protein
LRRLQLSLRLFSRLRLSERHSIYLWAAFVGFLGACAALGFQAATSFLFWCMTGHASGFVATFKEIEPWQRIAVPLVGAMCAGLILMLGQRFVRTRETDYMEAVSLGDGSIPLRSSLLRSFSALFSIASGASIGREGPLVQLAACASSVVGVFRGMAPPKRRLLVACGAAAGMSAAYHAPLGGAIFVAEVVIGSLAMESLGPLLIASIVSVLTVRAAGGVDTLYHFTGSTDVSLVEFILYPLLGIFCGLLAALWMRLLKESRFRFGAIPLPLWVRIGLGGLIAGALSVWCPEVAGNGAGVIRGMLNGEYIWSFVAFLLLAKVAATCAVFGSGAVGGVFTPSLLVGAAGGLLFSHFAGYFWPWGSLQPGIFAVAGMAALLAAAAQAPFTAILLLFEMTQRYDLVLPLAIAAIAGYSTMRALGVHGLYTESLRAGPRSVFDRSLSEISVGDILRPAPIRVQLNTSFGGIARAFLGGAGRELWVVDSHSCLLGEILLPDVEPYLKEKDIARSVIAGDLMREDLPRLVPKMSLPAALDVFSKTSSESLPVVSPENGKLVGSVGRADLSLTLSELTRRERARVV